MVIGHYEDALAFYGTDLGARVTRKHLGWYMARCGARPDLRKAVLTSDPASVLQLLPRALDTLAAA